MEVKRFSRPDENLPLRQGRFKFRLELGVTSGNDQFPVVHPLFYFAAANKSGGACGIEISLLSAAQTVMTPTHDVRLADLFIADKNGCSDSSAARERL